MKKLILVAAPPACGKSSVSDALCRELGHIAYFDKDGYAGLIDLVFDLTGNERDMDGAFYRDNVKAAQYETLFHMAKTAIKYEDLVLLDAPFAGETRNPETLRKLREELNASDTKLFVIWVLATPEQCHERMLRRGAQRDLKKLENWDAYVKTLDFQIPTGLEEAGAVDALLLVDTTDPGKYQKTLKETIRRIRE